MKIHPDLYHGVHKKKNFFEGWYFKVVDKTGTYALAFIPGISLGNKNEENHSFIQVINAVDNTYHYHRFQPNLLISNKNFLQVKIINNEFSHNKMNIDINNEQESIQGFLDFSPAVKWPDSKLNPGSMGFYNHFYFMECYSQVCALDGTIIKGNLKVNEKVINFSEGKYYIEKNWGKSFPSSWVWIQSNNFPNNRATITCSLGIVPFPFLKKFFGFLIGVTIDNRFYSFTTINRSSLCLNVHNKDLILTTSNRNNYLTLVLKTKSNRNEFLLCLGPKNGEMIPLVKETLTGEVEMTLIDNKHNKIIYQGVGKATGIEYGGNQKELLDAFLIP